MTPENVGSIMIPRSTKTVIEMSFYNEAIQEWVWIEGQDRPDIQWLLSNLDTWHLNPFYTGPDQGHPEDQDYN